MAQFNFEAIGTSWQIDIREYLSPEREDDILRAVRARIEEFDKAYSRFRPDSLVAKMSKEAGTFAMPGDFDAMFSLYRDLYIRTGGLVTPLVGSMLEDAGYDAAYSLRQKKELERPPRWEDAMEYRAGMLAMKRPAVLDFGAAGKGYLIDLVAAVLDSHGLTQYLIDAGGDMLHKGTEAARIGLEDPENAKQVIGVCSLMNGSICGSAGNRRAWGEFTHIMNPETLRSETRVLAVWVTAGTALVADALATCLFFVPPQKLSDGYDFEYVIVRDDRSAEVSPNFPGEMFGEQSL